MCATQQEKSLAESQTRQEPGNGEICMLAGKYIYSV